MTLMRFLPVAALSLALLAGPDAWADAAAGRKAYQLGDFDTALKEFSDAAKAGDPDSQLRLAVMLLRGEGAARDPARAADLLRAAATQGHVPAQFYLGRLYYGGVGVEKDAAQAAEWFLTAAKQGDLLSGHALSVLYARGDGVEKNPGKAVNLARWAAQAGLEDAQYQMGAFYYRGEVVPQDLGKAYYWFFIAGQRGMVRAQTIVKQVAAQLTPEELRQAEFDARKWEPRTEPLPSVD
jgi:TPR repeat protein